MNSIERILIVGGTHGNETSGLALLHERAKEQLSNNTTNLHLDFEVGNPKAVDANVRFTEDDLNRQFTHAVLTSVPVSYEASRAQVLNEQWGPKSQSKTDLVIDVHNTTSAMDATLIILELDDFHIGLARYVKHKMPGANILVEDEKPVFDHPYLCTIGKRGVMVEVGAQPQGVSRYEVAHKALQMTEAILAYCTEYNEQSADLGALTPIEGFRLGDIVQMPKHVDDTHAIKHWMIHPHIQDKDFSLLKQGEPVFASIHGEEIVWEHNDTYPHFINEAAYRRSEVAFATASKITI